jgi:16S rRNA (guanine527-N7)-methyltransferase
VNAPTDDLTAALAACRIELPDEQVAQVRRYCELLWEWNAKLNLTRHTDYPRFVSRDVVDSLAFADHLAPDEKILDVGTGGGVPGVLLAILRPDLRVWLSESVGKKARAVADIVQRLGLSAPVLHGRAEDFLPKSEFNSLVVRAVGTLKTLLTWLRPHWARFDRLLVLKGPAWVEERGEARHYGLLHDLALRKLTSYPMPGTESESVLLQICPPGRLEEGKTCRLRRVE